MKKSVIFLAFSLMALMACSKSDGIEDPITISSPTPMEQIFKVSLSESQKGYVKAGNAMAMRFLKQIYEGENLVCSPLSLQYALAMAANGASGETLQEIIDFLGYGSDGIDALNAYSKILMEQLPAVDLNVTLKVTDAMLVNEKLPLLPAYKKTLADYYYAPAENMDFSDPEKVAARINDWASRNTNGFIDNILSSADISPSAVAFLMNALYFKARWAGSEYEPMFSEEGTIDDSFTLSDGTVKTVKMMRNERYHAYAEMDGFKVLALPYAGGKFFMYILLPDKNDLPALMNKLQTVSWEDIQQNLKRDAEVHVKLPKFDIENKFNLNETLKALGVRRAFQQGAAQFDRMFSVDPEYLFWIGKVIQKAKINVAEWGTEAAAVTVVQMDGASEAPGGEIKKVYFYADHPFVFAIGESTSGTILFEGVFAGK